MTDKNISLAMFVVQAREKIGLSSFLLAKRSNLTEDEIQDIESGKELFLSSTVRQKLAKGLKIAPAEIKSYEKNVEIKFSNDNIKEFENIVKIKMMAGETEDLKCPVCGSEMNFKKVKRYDIEDNIVYDYKATCKKCPYQVT